MQRTPPRRWLACTRLMLAGLLLSQLAGCTGVKHFRAAGGTVVREKPRVLLMPPDVLLLEITTGGVAIPRADWSARAREVMIAASIDAVAARQGELIRYRRPAGADALPYARSHLPMLHLHQAVLQAILTYRYQRTTPGARRPDLPTRSTDGLEWTLGKTTTPLRADYGADYALFLSYRQATSNSGRAMLSAAALALFGIIAPTSESLGLASLVDLHSGEVVWTNLLTGQAVDVGEPDGLREKARLLLKAWPL